MSIDIKGITVFGIDIGEHFPRALTDQFSDEDWDDEDEAIERILGDAVEVHFYGNSFRGSRMILGVPGSVTNAFGAAAIKLDVSPPKVSAFKDACAAIGVSTEPTWLVAWHQG